jgi:hypothetical protein
MARPDASLVSVGRRPPTQSTMRTGGGPDQHDTGRVPSRRPIVTKFSVGGQIDPGSRSAKFGERGSIDADVVNYAYDGGPDQHDTGWVPSRRPIVRKFSVGGQIDPGSRPAKFGERGSIDADVVNYAYDGGPDDCPAVVSRDNGTGSLASRRPICLRFSGKIMGMQPRLSAKFCACCWTGQ